MASTTAMSASSILSSATSMLQSATPSPTNSPNNNNNTSGGDSGGGRPLLFFVALGFGVVFTNLWIIVGVKYCFRYNQRNRQNQVDQESGEPIDMTNMPRPRRRREKKLMSMEDVNERFPLIKYKTWRATREQKGLPAAGGVTAPPSRAASIKETMLERYSTEQDESSFADPSHSSAAVGASENSASRDLASHAKAEEVSEGLGEKEAADEKHKTGSSTVAVTPTPASPSAVQQDEDDEEDPIRTAVPNELLQAPGDACAICIDNLDDEDEVRGLTCGHAFHAGCLDPWLTSRRACCPLCKADYYVPKQRAQTGDAVPELDAPNVPTNQDVFRAPPGMVRGRVVFAGSRFHIDHHQRYGFPVLVRDRVQPYHTDAHSQSGVHNQLQLRSQLQQQQTVDNVDQQVTDASEGAPEVQPSTSPSGIGARAAQMFRGIPARLRPRHDAGNSDGTSSALTSQATPGQLEAGTAPR